MNLPYFVIGDELVTAPVPPRVGDAGLDLIANHDAAIEPGKRALVGTGYGLIIPGHAYGQIFPRSSMAVRGIDTSAGVIDSSYRGEIKVLLVNNSDARETIVKGQRIAQLVLIHNVQITDCRVVDDVTATARGADGFGSTGH